MKRAIAVIGPSSCDEQQAATAEAVGRLLAAREVVLICGGRGGVMEAACRGAQQAGGLTVGILPGTDPTSGNAFLSLAIPTGMGEARNAIVAQAGEAVIAIGGGPGTLSEIALAIKAGRRVVVLDSWQARASDGTDLAVVSAAGPEVAVALALEEAV